MSNFLFSRFRSPFLLILTALAVGLFFITPDLVEWWRVDHFQTPVRALGFDQIHYLTNLHRLQVEGTAGSSMFTWEHRDEPSRFLFFDAFMKHLPGFTRIPIIWWQLILKFFSSLAVFIGLYGLFRAGRIKADLALLLALAATFLYNPYAMQGSGLSSWFLIFFLLGFVVFAFAVVWRPYSPATLVASIFLLFLSTAHPVNLLSTIGVTGLWWLNALWQKRKEARVWLYACLWLFAASVCVWLLFGNYIKFFLGYSYPVVSDGFFERNGGVYMYFPPFPLIAARFGFLTAALYVGYRKCRESLDAAVAPFWLMLLFLAIQGFIFNVQNIITGFSVFAERFTVFEEFVVIPVAVMILFTVSEARNAKVFADSFGIRPPVEFTAPPEIFRGLRLQKIIGIGLLTITAIFIVSLTLDRPIRSWLVLGRWAPLIAGYVVIVFWLLVPERLARFSSKAIKLLPVVLLLCIAYAGLLLWRFYVYDVPVQNDFQANRQIFSRLSGLSPGVVMASPEMSEYAALYTHHRVYWSWMISQFGGTYEEFVLRLTDEHLVFEGNTELGADLGRFSIFGAPNQWCAMLTEKLFYAKIREAGIANVTTCDTAGTDRDWPRYLAEYAQRRNDIAHGGAWVPRYRLDWLVVDESKDRVSAEMLRRYFEKVESVGDSTIYRYKASSI